MEIGGEEGARGGAKSYDGETAWFSVNHSILYRKTRKRSKSGKKRRRGGGGIKRNDY
jgi:hypothetical protein